ncbi:ACT domain-containing protein [Clostridium aminobutyricum]|uniref:ACT domain-containing protein n=1 Tax=Clostridium aminobutyricum TaxID=33953 RepID=A0A939IFX9_CLOAM|nr:ACT domain-containing protein [Clostridium aminobutyricum]MBN7772135.1 ACT domain-containing protein [Clostridium aminobutyricum]
MAIKQLSILIPNQKGALAELTETFCEADIDIRAISVSDTTEYGILRTVVDDSAKAIKCLADKGIIAKESEILAINPEDKRGSLTAIFKLLGENDINIDYIYSFVVRKKEDQYFVLKVDDIPKAEKLLEENDVEVIRSL